MVTKLMSFGDEQRLFLQAYFSGGQYREELIAILKADFTALKLECLQLAQRRSSL
jgi:hypothetical protein